MLRIDQEVHDITNLPVYGEEHGGLTHLIFITIFLYVLCNSLPHYQHELTQFRSKIFRGFHFCSVLHVHDISTQFCIIKYDVPLSYLSITHDNIMLKYLKFRLSICKGHEFSSRKIETIVWQFCNISYIFIFIIR